MCVNVFYQFWLRMLFILFKHENIQKQKVQHLMVFLRTQKHLKISSYNIHFPWNKTKLQAFLNGKLMNEWECLIRVNSTAMHLLKYNTSL